MFCSNCGNEIPNDSVVCGICGTPTGDGAPQQEAQYQSQPEQQPYQQYQYQAQPQYQYGQPPVAPPTNKPRSAYFAALLHLFFATLGLGYFYRGMNDKGKNCIIMLIVGAVTAFLGVGVILIAVVEIINLVEAIKLFSGKTTKDAYGRDLYQEF